MFACCCAAQVEGTAEDTALPSVLALSSDEVPPAAGEEEPKMMEDVKQEPAPAEKEVPAPEPSASPQAAFEVAIDTAQDPLGLIADARGATLMVVSVNAGVLKKYNEAAEAAKQVRPGDFIVEANGKSEPDAMMKELSVKGSHKLKVQHPVTLKVAVKKDGKSLGLQLAYASMSTSIAIKGILDGAVQEYSKTAPADAQIKVEDRIMAIGTVAGEAGKMVEALKAADTVEFTIARVSP